MSKRLRTEVEAQSQLKNEADEEDNKIQKQKEKIFAPITWAKLASGFRIEDLREKNYKEVLDMILADYMRFEVLCRNSQILEDEVSTKSFLDHCMFYMKDASSLVIYDENEGNAVAGVLLLRVVNKVDYGRVFSRSIYNNGEAFKKLHTIRTAINRRVDIYEQFKCDTFLDYLLLCIKPEYRKKNLGYQLMRSGLDVARSLDIPIVMGLFSSFSLQKTAKRLSFQLIQEIHYTNWRDKKTNEFIFNNPGAGNYSFALMVGVVPEKSIPDANVLKVLTPGAIDLAADLAKKEPPKTRQEKRIANK